jgi:fucose permease
VGALGNNIFASWFIERLGPRAILAVAVPTIGAASVLIALAPSATACFGALALYGVSFAAANMAMNVEADRVEAFSGRRVMNRCHGVWSLGFLLAAGLGALARGLAIAPLWHFLGVLPVALALSVLVVAPMAGTPPRAHAGHGRKKVFALPTAPTVLLFGVLLATLFGEMSVRSWSVIYMRDSFAVPEWYEALSLPAFLGTLTLGRLVADGVVERFGPVRVASSLLLVGMAGLAIVVWAEQPALALFGFALMGLGLCVIFPLTVSAAARIGDRPASENVTSVVLMANVAMLGLPAVVGLAAEEWGIRSAFLLSMPVFAVALLLAQRLGIGAAKMAE